MIRRTALQLLLGGAAALPMTAMLAGQARASSNDGGGSGANDSSSSGSFGGNDNSSSGSFGGNDDNGTSGSSNGSNGGSSPNSPSGPDDTLSGSSSNDDLLRLQQTQNIDQSLNDDGLDPVSMDNLANVLADFQ
ncbi:hypothetical protein [Roseobacter sp. HKCCD7870]|uniref:hypothetical protein n=1 Tax=Roseobacter sp. HKCCD7870 TaxID=3120343 RepID=UPI0030EB2EB7